MVDDFEENPTPVVEDVESDDENISGSKVVTFDETDSKRTDRNGFADFKDYKSQRAQYNEKFYPAAFRLRRQSTVNLDSLPVWTGLNKSMLKWKGLSPKIVKEQIKTSRVYSAKLIIFIIFFIFGFALCFIEMGGNMKINQTAGKCLLLFRICL